MEIPFLVFFVGWLLFHLLTDFLIWLPFDSLFGGEERFGRDNPKSRREYEGWLSQRRASRRNSE